VAQGQSCGIIHFADQFLRNRSTKSIDAYTPVLHTIRDAAGLTTPGQHSLLKRIITGCNAALE
jgi:hypothetical protein